MAVKPVKIPAKDFETQKLMKYSEAELRKEYTRLRGIANKRLTTFEKSEFTESETYRYNRGRYVKLDEIKNKSELVDLLIDAKRFTTGERGSVTGQKRIRADYIASMQEKGFDWVNESNYFEWLDFLQFVKEKVGYSYDAEDIGKVFEESKPDNGMSKAEAAKKAFERYQEEHTIE